LNNTNDKLSGIRPLCQDSLLRRTHFLIPGGYGLRNTLWVVDFVSHNPHEEDRSSSQMRSLELFLMALKILWMACLSAIPERAIYRFRIQLYRIKTNRWKKEPKS